MKCMNNLTLASGATCEAALPGKNAPSLLGLSGAFGRALGK